MDAFADAGETEAMLLYKQISADKLLIDDQRGRKVAKINQISIIGSLGVLLVPSAIWLFGSVFAGFIGFNCRKSKKPTVRSFC